MLSDKPQVWSLPEEWTDDTAGYASSTRQTQPGSLSAMPGVGFDGSAGTLALLEFDQIRSAVGSYIHTLMGRKACMSLMPSSDVLDIATRQQETSEARRFIDHGGALEFGPEENFQEFIHRAMLGGLLRGEELHAIQEMIRAARNNRTNLLRHEELPLLSAIAENIPDLRSLDRSIVSAISVASSALPI